MFNKSQIKLVIFDLDGTLVDTQPDIVLSTQHIIREFGFPARDEEYILRCIGGGAKNLIRRVAGDATQQRLDAALALFVDYYQAHCSEASRPYPGAHELLERLSEAGVSLAVATMKARPATLKILRDFDLERFFFRVLCIDDVTRPKPDPECVNLLLAQLARKPDAALMVGDAPTDVQTGKNAGIYTCGALYGYGLPEEIRGQGPDCVIESLGGLSEFV